MTQEEKIIQLESQLQLALNRITQLEIRINSMPYPAVMPMTPGAPYPYNGRETHIRLCDNTWETK